MDKKHLTCRFYHTVGFSQRIPNKIYRALAKINICLKLQKPTALHNRKLFLLTSIAANSAIILSLYRILSLLKPNP